MKLLLHGSCVERVGRALQVWDCVIAVEGGERFYSAYFGVLAKPEGARIAPAPYDLLRAQLLWCVSSTLLTGSGVCSEHSTNSGGLSWLRVPVRESPLRPAQLHSQLCELTSVSAIC